MTHHKRSARAVRATVISLALVVTLAACDALDFFVKLGEAVLAAGVGFDSEDGLAIGGLTLGGGRAQATYTVPSTIDVATLDNDETLTGILLDPNATTTYGLIGPTVPVTDFEKDLSTLFGDDDLSSVDWTDVLVDNGYGSAEFGTTFLQSPVANATATAIAGPVTAGKDLTKDAKYVIDLPAENGRPFEGPYESRDVNADRVWQFGGTACVGGGLIGGAITGILTRNVAGAGGGALAGCAGGVAGNTVYQIFYADQVTVFYPVVNGKVNQDPKSWRVCTDYKVRTPDSNALNPTGEFVQFRYPADYPDKGLAGTTQPFSRNCTRIGEGGAQ